MFDKLSLNWYISQGADCVYSTGGGAGGHFKTVVTPTALRITLERQHAKRICNVSYDACGDDAFDKELSYRPYGNFFRTGCSCLAEILRIVHDGECGGVLVSSDVAAFVQAFVESYGTLAVTLKCISKDVRTQLQEVLRIGVECKYTKPICESHVKKMILKLKQGMLPRDKLPRSSSTPWYFWIGDSSGREAAVLNLIEQIGYLAHDNQEYGPTKHAINEKSVDPYEDRHFSAPSILKGAAVSVSQGTEKYVDTWRVDMTQFTKSASTLALLAHVVNMEKIVAYVSSFTFRICVTRMRWHTNTRIR
jgi:hypothetical protein